MTFKLELDGHQVHCSSPECVWGLMLRQGWQLVDPAQAEALRSELERSAALQAPANPTSASPRQ